MNNQEKVCSAIKTLKADAEFTFDGEINYPDSFNIRDYATDLIYYQQAKSIGIGSATFMKEVDKEIARAVIDDNEKLNDIFDEIDVDNS